MSYVDSNLLPGEKVIIKAKIHWIVFVSSILTGIIAWFSYAKLGQPLLTLVIAVFALADFITATIRYYFTELAVTDRRVIVKLGFIKRDTYELNVNRVTTLNVDQSVLGRLFDYGDITVVGMGGSLTPIRSIVDPLRFRRMLLAEVEGTRIDG
jgi:uncharacterized membrane protein YdbT with pleckstrin-like domain